MSFFDPNQLRSASDNRIPTETLIFDIPIGVPPLGGFEKEFMLEQNKIVKEFKIINNDSSISLKYILYGRFNKVSRTVPPNSDEVVTGWTNYIRVDPSNITKAGQLEVDLANIDDAKRLIE